MKQQLAKGGVIMSIEIMIRYAETMGKFVQRTAGIPRRGVKVMKVKNRHLKSSHEELNFLDHRNGLNFIFL